ncbi:MAG TPA: tetratricopeptide repeat protein, partial [Nitrososphaeraceae archaeon]|nr:tetratricopeptide repeat protein [Nitrososphaeraceae archaeon]
MSLESLDRHEEAEQYYNMVSEKYLKEINDVKKKATEYQNLHKYEEALLYYDILLTIDTKNKFNTLLNKGVILYKLNKYEEAIECYDKVIEKDPDNIEALNAKGLALEKLRKYDDAIQLFDLVIAKNPPFVIDTIIKKGDIFMELENYPEAEKSYNDALKSDQNNISALNKLHTLYSNYTFQYDKAISVSKRLLKNTLEREVKINTKLLLVQDLINDGNYEQGKKIAKEVIKNSPFEAIRRRGIGHALIIIAYLLQRNKLEGIKELINFLVYYTNLDVDIKYEKNQWNFKGLINTINKNQKIDSATKTILRNLIDLLHGDKDSQKRLSKIATETLEEEKKIKIRNKIKKTAIISLVVMAALSIYYVQMTVLESCSVPESRQINIGDVGSAPIGIDFNPNNNKAYVANEKDSTISIIDCNVPRYYNIFKQYFGFDTQLQLQVEDKTISLDNPPSGIAVNPTTNKIYVIHQLPSPSLSIIDGNNNYQKLNFPMGRYPVDIAVDPIINKVYVANSIDGNVSVIDGETDKWIGDIDVGDKLFSVAINPTTNKLYVTHEGSNIVSIIDETKEKDNIKNISLYQFIADLNINSKTNKVYVTYPINNTITVIDGTSDTKIKEIDVGDKPIRIDIDEEADKVFVVNQDSDSVSVIDGATDTIIKTLKIPSKYPYDVEFNSDINSLYVINMGSNSRSTVDIMKYDDNDDDNNLNYIHVGDKPVDIDVNPKTKKAYVVNYNSDTLSIINSTNRVEEIIDVGDKPRSIAVNPTTNKIYVTHQTPSSPSLSIIDENNNYQILQENITIGKDPVDIAVNPITNKVYVANYGDGTVSVINGKTDQLINEGIDVDENAFTIDVNPNTNKVYVGYSNNFHLSVIDDKSNRLLRDINDEPVKIGLFY